MSMEFLKQSGHNRIFCRYFEQQPNQAHEIYRSYCLIYHQYPMDIRIWVNESNQRFDRFLRKYFRQSSWISLTQIYGWIRKWQVKVNSCKQTEKYTLVLDDIVMIHDQIVHQYQLWSTADKSSKPSLNITQIRQQLIAEDDDRIVWNKPPHLLVHPAHNLSEITLNDYLESYYTYQTKQGILKSNLTHTCETFKPSFGFRLDKDTSGVIIGAKHYHALQYLNEQIRLRQTIKRYIAIVSGHLRQIIQMQQPLFKWFSEVNGKAKVFVNESKWLPAHTTCIPLLTTQDSILWATTAVLLRLHTGRMHQIRVHCAHHGYPIIWDLLYGDDHINHLAYRRHHITRQLLHCYQYGIISLHTSSLHIQKDTNSNQQSYQQWIAPLPSDMTQLFDVKTLQHKIDSKLK